VRTPGRRQPARRRRVGDHFGRTARPGPVRRCSRDEAPGSMLPPSLFSARTARNIPALYSFSFARFPQPR
jgi:hypothetical protein